MLVGTGQTQWGMDHIPLRCYPTSDSLRGQSLYRIDRQLCTITLVPLTSRRKIWRQLSGFSSSYAQGETEVGPM